MDETAGQSFAVKSEHIDDSIRIEQNGFLRLHQHGGAGHGFYWMGDFVDRRGFVSVYRQDGLTRLDVVADGRMHIRSWQRYFGDRTIARLARAMLTDLIGAPA